jgi:Mrp family chromosome partitioning ATPase/capsular polysaccharide biosynthesis protein
MTDMDANQNPAPNWLGVLHEESELHRYAAILRRRGWLIVVTVILALAAAGVYVKTATPVYKAQASLQVSPIPAGTSFPANLPGLIYQSSDPTRDIQTAAGLVDSIAVARIVQNELHLAGTPSQVLAKFGVAPVSNSNIIAITASADSAARAAVLANTFARATIVSRTAQFRSAVRQEIVALTPSASGPGSSTATTPTGVSASAELSQLKTLEAGALPDMSISAPAVPPSGRSSPRAALSLAAGLVVGLVLGILAILAIEAFDSKLRREDQLADLFRLPILARIPDERGTKSRMRRRSKLPRPPKSLSFVARESFRTLRAMSLATGTSEQPQPRSLIVTGSGASEGKTTTALNLAVSLGGAGGTVILIEGDLRRPAIGKALGISSQYDVTSVVTGEVALESALVSDERYPGVNFLLAESGRTDGSYAGDALFLPSARRMLERAEQVADFVVVDSPPLLAVIDALDLARSADAVLIVARLGSTDLRRLAALGELLQDAHIVPVGIALIGADVPGGRGDYNRYGTAPDDANPLPLHRTSARAQDEPDAALERRLGRVTDRT